jgi:hypothetical protein
MSRRRRRFAAAERVGVGNRSAARAVNALPAVVALRWTLFVWRVTQTLEKVDCLTRSNHQLPSRKMAGTAIARWRRDAAVLTRHPTSGDHTHRERTRQAPAPACARDRQTDRQRTGARLSASAAVAEPIGLEDDRSV